MFGRTTVFSCKKICAGNFDTMTWDNEALKKEAKRMVRKSIAQRLLTDTMSPTKGERLLKVVGK